MQNLTLLAEVVYWSIRASIRNRLVPPAAHNTLYFPRKRTKKCFLGKNAVLLQTYTIIADAKPNII